jgi:hypothetical protein
MNKHIVVLVFLGLFGMLAAGACEVDAGIGGSDVCQVCGDALANGTDGDFCTPTDESDYSDLQSCGCGDGSGPCDDICSDNFCTDSGDDPDCDACLSDNCGPVYDNCNAD